MDLPGMQLSPLLGYGNLPSAAAPRTPAGGRRDKNPPREVSASWDLPSQRAPSPSEGVPGGSLHTGSTQKPCTAPRSSLLTEMCLFTAAYIEFFQHATFHFLMSTRRIGLQQSLHPHRHFLFQNGARFNSFPASRSSELTSVSMPTLHGHALGEAPWLPSGVIRISRPVSLMPLC